MEVLVEAPSGQVPKGCFVSVRLGETLKQRRFDKANAKYQFPMPDGRRKAKIDVYQLVGTTSIHVDPDLQISDEVLVASADPIVDGMKLRVSAGAKDAKPEDETKMRKEVEAETKEAAIGYLSQHGIEQRLSECLRTLLRMKPDDPIDFLCKQLKAGGPVPKPVKKEVPPPAATAQAPPAAKSATPAPAAQATTVPTLGPTRFALKPSVGTWMMPLKRKPAAAAAPTAPAPSFAMKPSVGTWLMHRPAASAGGASCTASPAEVAVLKAQARESLLAAAQDGSLKAVVQESKAGCPAAMSASQAEALKAQAREGLMAACANGSLRREVEALKSQGCTAAPRTVGTWLADPRGALRLKGLGCSSAAECSEAERVLSKAFMELGGDLEGEYFPFSKNFPLRPGGILPEEVNDLQSKCLHFQAADANGRGVFLTHGEDVACWINESKHLQILVKQGLPDEELTRKIDAVAKSLHGSLIQDGYSLIN
eukprot:gb/GFBE01007625.1/.p1 GENE.gb/GFBE01007625.1/~~gb/GFBE01007625.1/.p1  ORF type:complete len:482 (+),score=137.52 gb/GFBE01007625.1/:1-1446(+)